MGAPPFAPRPGDTTFAGMHGGHATRPQIVSGPSLRLTAAPSPRRVMNVSSSKLFVITLLAIGKPILPPGSDVRG